MALILLCPRMKAGHGDAKLPEVKKEDIRVTVMNDVLAKARSVDVKVV